MGDLLVEVEKCSENLLKQTTLADLSVTVTSHRALNSSQGVISENYLESETEVELLQVLQNQGVTHVKSNEG
ncbi:hypothetical protein HPB48_015419 [Haemaphysalis longicornis]|uniref:Uncharacterized protein n=1 Tax=Haemaphysalis longicornis TaxID=44386 RepID=A0A9J6GQT4_HAELO|nr:hypothetical protein HPB48_015419 [Haemaphysalis longicornis]